MYPSRTRMRRRRRRRKSITCVVAFSYSSYSQSYALPEDADQEKISAEVSDGVLKIEIPKIAKEEKKDVKHIEVK